MENELGRRVLALTGSDGPKSAVEIEEGVYACQIHIGVPVRVKGTDIPPVLRVAGSIDQLKLPDAIGIGLVDIITDSVQTPVGIRVDF